MAFNPSPGTEKRAVVNPKDLRFTQLDIASSFTNPEQYLNFEDTISQIQRRQLDPAEFGDLTVHTDKEGVVWCENNRRLFVFRKAGVRSVRVKFGNNDYISRRIKEADKMKLNDPNFLPRIRGETSGASFDQEEMVTSLLGFVGAVSAVAAAGCWAWKLYNSQPENREDNDDDRNKK